MKSLFPFRCLALIVLGLSLGSGRVHAANGFGFSAVSSTNLIYKGNPLTYTVNVTNQTTLTLNVFVTNTLSSPLLFQTATNFPLTTVPQTNANSILFTFAGLFPNQIAQMSFSVTPAATGPLTNFVFLATDTITNFIATNVVVQVTNIVIASDLAVGITGPAQSVIVNDWMTYGIAVTNFGPNDAPGVFVTNTPPAGAKLIATNQAFSLAGTNMVFSLGTVSNGGFKLLSVTLQPTNAGALNLLAVVGAPSVTDTNTANNSASNVVTVLNYSGTLLAFTNSPQTTNRQYGVIEQTILVTNAGVAAVAAARVVVTGLTNRLFNAFGTNNGNPFVVYAGALNPNQAAQMVLQYYVPGIHSFAFTNSQLHAYGVPAPNLAPPPLSASATNLNITRLVRLASGNVVIEFPTTTNRTYTVVYSDGDATFANAKMAVPPFSAPANFAEWIDYGPPGTATAPTNVSARFYRVLQFP